MRRILAVAMVALMAVPALAQVSEDDLDRAQERLDAAQAEANGLAAQLEEAYVRQLALDEEIHSLRTSMELTQARLADAEADVQDLAVQMYMGASSSVSLTVLLGAGDDAASAGLEYVRRVTGIEESSIATFQAVQAEFERQSSRLSQAESEQASVTAKLEDLATRAQATLMAASADYDALAARRAAQLEAERRRREEAAAAAAAAALAATSTTTTTTVAPQTNGGDTSETTTSTTSAGPATTTTVPPPPPPTGGSACPVAGAVSFVDSWGAARSGGRGHQGVDMMAVSGTPVAAIYDGTISRMSNSGLGGITIWLHAQGDSFYYAHLQGYADGISPGSSVSAGQIIAYVGSTGNASAAYPHLHFEHHPGHGGAINPYPLVSQIC